jgi:hypothetical protein
MSRLARVFTKELKFAGWRSFWTFAAAFVTIGLALDSYRVWRDGDTFRFWTRLGMNIFVVVIGALIWSLDAARTRRNAARGSSIAPLAGREEK